MLHKYNVLFIGKTFLSNSIYKDLFLFLTDLYPNTNGVISLFVFSVWGPSGYQMKYEFAIRYNKLKN